jgi:DNA-binding response OmpR family regulator
MLICDDESITLRALDFQFKKDGFEIFKANNGREAQKILVKESEIDVLVTDIYMPLMSGLELITYVRKVLQRDIPIVVVSKANLEDTILHALELGADSYFTKPFNLDELSKRVKHLLKT